jgi:hypothetical protein
MKHFCLNSLTRHENVIVFLVLFIVQLIYLLPNLLFSFATVTRKFVLNPDVNESMSEFLKFAGETNGKQVGRL